MGGRPELAHCSDLGAFIVKKYAPAAERARELVPSKNKRFAEFARVVALGAARPHRRVRPRLRPRLRVRLGGRGRTRGASSVRGASSAPTTTPTTTPRRRRCTASSFAKVEGLGIDLGEQFRVTCHDDSTTPVDRGRAGVVPLVGGISQHAVSCNVQPKVHRTLQGSATLPRELCNPTRVVRPACPSPFSFRL